jgi:CRISPR-associated protein Cas4
MVTATQLSSYLYCPRKLFLSSVLLLKEPDKEEMIKGKIWHKTHEFINNSAKNIVCSIRGNNYDSILDLYRKNYSAYLRNAIIRYKIELKKFNLSMIDIFKEYWPDIEEEAKRNAFYVSEFIAKNDVYGLDLWNKLTPKMLSEQYFKSINLDLSGIIDVIEIHNINGTLSYVPIELKTGNYPDFGIWEGHKIQLAAYIMILEDLGKNVSNALVEYRGSDRRVLVMDDVLRTQIKDLIIKINTLLNADVLPDFVDNKNKCLSCSFKEECYDISRMDSMLLKKQQNVKKAT